jgi:hypothetical protein
VGNRGKDQVEGNIYPQLNLYDNPRKGPDEGDGAFWMRMTSNNAITGTAAGSAMMYNSEIANNTVTASMNSPMSSASISPLSPNTLDDLHRQYGTHTTAAGGAANLNVLSSTTNASSSASSSGSTNFNLNQRPIERPKPTFFAFGISSTPITNSNTVGQEVSPSNEAYIPNRLRIVSESLPNCT